MNINDTLLVTINLSDIEESTVEVVTYLGQYRDVINVFRGSEAELIYKSLMNVNKQQLKAYLEQLSKRNELNPSTEIVEDLTFNDISEIENMSEIEDGPNLTELLYDVTLMGAVLKPNLSAEDLKWLYANPALGKITTKEVNGETIYVLDKFPQEDNNDRSFEEPEIETGTTM